MDMLELEDAYKVSRQYMIDSGYHFDDEEDGVILRRELTQKMWLGKVHDVQTLINAIRPENICTMIADDKLGEWCEVMQGEFIRALKEMENG